VARVHSSALTLTSTRVGAAARSVCPDTAAVPERFACLRSPQL
jgi:hypothetical protein